MTSDAERDTPAQATALRVEPGQRFIRLADPTPRPIYAVVDVSADARPLVIFRRLASPQRPADAGPVSDALETTPLVTFGLYFRRAVPLRRPPQPSEEALGLIEAGVTFTLYDPDTHAELAVSVPANVFARLNAALADPPVPAPRGDAGELAELLSDEWPNEWPRPLARVTALGRRGTAVAYRHYSQAGARVLVRLDGPPDAWYSADDVLPETLADDDPAAYPWPQPGHNVWVTPTGNEPVGAAPVTGDATLLARVGATWALVRLYPSGRRFHLPLDRLRFPRSGIPERPVRCPTVKTDGGRCLRPRHPRSGPGIGDAGHIFDIREGVADALTEAAWDRHG